MKRSWLRIDLRGFYGGKIFFPMIGVDQILVNPGCVLDHIARIGVTRIRRVMFAMSDSTAVSEAKAKQAARLLTQVP